MQYTICSDLHLLAFCSYTSVYSFSLIKNLADLYTIFCKRIRALRFPHRLFNDDICVRTMPYFYISFHLLPFQIYNSLSQYAKPFNLKWNFLVYKYMALENAYQRELCIHNELRSTWSLQAGWYRWWALFAYTRITRKTILLNL